MHRGKVSVTLPESLCRLRLPADLEQFRQEVRAFLRVEMAPQRIAGHRDASDLTGLDETFERAHHRRAGERGYLGISAPRALGGGGKPPSWKAVYMYEAAYHDAPSIDTAMVLCGPALLRHGTTRQHAELLTPMMRGELTGCAAFSEREAGSDLAAVATTARRERDGWRVRGTKALVTGAHKADVCLLLAVTEPEKPAREAMSLFIFRLDRPGVRVRRRQTMNRWTLSEIDFEDARLEDADLLGERGAGLPMSLTSVADERSGLAWLAWAVRLVELLAARFDDPRVVERAIEVGVARRFCERVIALQDAGQPVRHEASVAKLYITELLQRIARLGVELEGDGALHWSPLFGTGSRFAYEVLERIHAAVSVGANEVQRDMIGRMALKLPRT